jgi:hypothetical protein
LKEDTLPNPLIAVNVVKIRQIIKQIAFCFPVPRFCCNDPPSHANASAFACRSSMTPKIYLCSVFYLWRSPLAKARDVDWGKPFLMDTKYKTNADFSHGSSQLALRYFISFFLSKQVIP